MYSGAGTVPQPGGLGSSRTNKYPVDLDHPNKVMVGSDYSLRASKLILLATYVHSPQACLR